MSVFFMLIDVAILLISMAGLAVFSEKALNQTIKVAETFGNSLFAVGFILVAVATSLPEFVVSVTAALSGDGGIAVGNVIGSNIANIALILGIVAIIGYVKLQHKEMMQNADILLFITLIPLLFIGRSIGPIFGILLLGLFAAYCFFILKRERASITYDIFDPDTGKFVHEKRKRKKFNSFYVVLLATFSIVMVVLAADLLVGSASSLMSAFGMPSSFIGLTVIAFGTSLPELVIAVRAIKKGYTSLALGDIIGSCVVNLTLVLGTAIALNPVALSFELFSTSLIVLAGINILLWYSLTKHEGIPTILGIVFVLIYFLFVVSEAGLLIIR